VLAKALAAAGIADTWPVDNTMPLSKDSEDVPLKMPFAVALQVSVAPYTVTPLPTNLLASAAAVAPGVTVSCAVAVFGDRNAENNKKLNNANIFLMGLVVLI
jgi:hypothetical protein